MYQKLSKAMNYMLKKNQAFTKNSSKAEIKAVFKQYEDINKQRLK